MELNISGERFLSTPCREDIRKAVSSLVGGPQGGFLILGKTEQTYIQCSGSPETGFVLEYQEQDVGHHYVATRLDLTEEDLVRALTSYLEETGEWKSISPWEAVSW